MIGYYVHRRGLGHLHRALAVMAEIDESVAILSSLPRPASFTGDWVRLPLDTDIAPIDATAGGALHWVPVRFRGLSARMGAISRWIDAAHPSALIVDMSVEVVALVRLHGVNSDRKRCGCRKGRVVRKGSERWPISR